MTAFRSITSIPSSRFPLTKTDYDEASHPESPQHDSVWHEWVWVWMWAWVWVWVWGRAQVCAHRVSTHFQPRLTCGHYLNNVVLAEAEADEG